MIEQWIQSALQFRSGRWHRPAEQGFSLSEALIIVVVIGVLLTTVVSVSLRELRRYRVDSAAALYASWLDAVGRSALKGQGCLATLTVGSPVAASAAAATAAADTSTTASTAISNPCTDLEELKLSRDGSNTSFIVSTTPTGVSSIVFTPRGTIYNPASATGSFSSELSIKLQSYENGSAQEPAKCVTIQAPIGQVRTSNCT